MASVLLLEFLVMLAFPTFDFVPAVASFPVLAGVLALARVPADPGVPILPREFSMNIELSKSRKYGYRI
jgi:hypothetical protein